MSFVMFKKVGGKREKGTYLDDCESVWVNAVARDGLCYGEKVRYFTGMEKKDRENMSAGGFVKKCWTNGCRKSERMSVPMLREREREMEYWIENKVNLESSFLKVFSPKLEYWSTQNLRLFKREEERQARKRNSKKFVIPKWAIPGPFFLYFWSFQMTVQFLTARRCEIWHISYKVQFTTSYSSVSSQYH